MPDEPRGILRGFKDNFLANVLEDARRSDHLKSPHMEPIYKIIESYVIEHRLHISNEPGGTTRQYRVFGARIFFHANDLSGAIAEVIPYVRMNTIVREKEFDIQIDGARVVHLYNIDPTFAKIISPCGAVADATEPIKIPAEVELVDVYHRLYSPNHHSSWETLYDYECDLWRQFSATRNKILECAGSGNNVSLARNADIKNSDHHPRERSRSRSRGKHKVRGGISDAHLPLVTKWLESQREYAIVGNFALTCMNGGKCPTTGAVQIIVNDVKRAIDSLSAELSKFIPKASVETRVYDLQLPTDYRIKKHVVLARVGRDVYYIANLFNCASFELIPVVHIGGLNVASSEVILRFLFIELWFVRVVREFGKLGDGEYSELVDTLFENIDTVHKSWGERGPLVAQPMYIGTYIDEVIGKKTEDMVAPYFPAQYKRENGAYRSLRGDH